ncbi:MAG: 16S rRNA (cytidine(1402)-2'-O)-methyltransferase [Acidobacteria bacterium]|nr:16S rRNA (cytidine(1402)-2'-O)-methyltransferase [Acidobacteriota bacterium]
MSRRGGTKRGAAPPAAATAAGRLLVVATPLGNLGDITSRALEALRSARLVACEDTRRTRALLSHFGLAVPTVSCHKFNESSRAGGILEALKAGQTVALVTDAGTPGVSDPGALLVAEAAAAGIVVEAIPGPSAPAAAMSVSGFSSGGYVFAGFAPPRTSARRRFLRALVAAEAARVAEDPSAEPWPIVFFEAPHRILAFLSDVRVEMGDRAAVIVRELTKLHEEVLRGAPSDLLAALDRGAPRGEFTIVVAGRPAPSAGAERGAAGTDVRKAYRDLVAAGVERRDALRRVSRLTGRSRREIYREVAREDDDSEE